MDNNYLIKTLVMTTRIINLFCLVLKRIIFMNGRRCCINCYFVLNKLLE